MRLWIAVVDKKAPAGPAAKLLEDYVARAGRYLPCQLQLAATETKLLESVGRAESGLPDYFLISYLQRQQQRRH